MKCTICKGRGRVPAGYYGDDEGIVRETLDTPGIATEQCRACNGLGRTPKPDQEHNMGEKLSFKDSIVKEDYNE